MAEKRAIVLKGQPYLDEDGAASASITPGYAVDMGVTSVGVHATANGPGRRYALERDELGNDIDEAYAIGDYVKVGNFYPGQRVLVWVASGQDISAGDLLGHAGDGTVKDYASGEYAGRALETIGAVVVLTRLRMEVM
jgi:hypothetical protein